MSLQGTDIEQQNFETYLPPNTGFKRYLKDCMRHISLLSSPTDRPLEWTW